jgi:hypothetical protein
VHLLDEGACWPAAGSGKALAMCRPMKASGAPPKKVAVKVFTDWKRPSRSTVKIRSSALSTRERYFSSDLARASVLASTRASSTLDQRFSSQITVPAPSITERRINPMSRKKLEGAFPRASSTSDWGAITATDQDWGGWPPPQPGCRR